MLLKLVQRICRKIWQDQWAPAHPASEELTPAQARFIRMAERFPPLQRFRPGVFRLLHWCIERPFSPDKEKMARVQDYRVPVVSTGAAKGAARVKVRAYYPLRARSSQPQPAVVYFHGGGCVIGSVASHDIFCRYVASPLLTESLAGLPPTFLLTVGHDPLMDEGQSYAAALKEQNCSLVQWHYPGCMHGFIAFSGVCKAAKKAVDDAIQVFPALDLTFSTKIAEQ
jgi:acetyl esterase/lipase